jgi:hypothetical protein
MGERGWLRGGKLSVEVQDVEVVAAAVRNSTLAE